MPRRLTIAELELALMNAQPEITDPAAESFISMLRSGRHALQRDPQVFDFGSTQRLEEVDKAMAAELWNKKLLRLPFPVTIFTFKHGEPGREVRLTLLAIADANIFVGEDPAASNATAVLIFSQHSEISRRVDAFAWFEVPDGNNLRLGATALSDCPGETDDSFKKFTAVSIARLMTLCMLLNTKGIRKRHEPLPIKLNAKRARSGKAPLDAVTYVDLDSVSSGGHATGKGREMPMHFRRGHIRHFDDGSITWVRDAIIKADGELKQRSRYQVK